MTEEVRPIRADELEAALPLIADYQRFYGVEYPNDERNRRFFARFLDPSNDGLLLGAWVDGELVGFATLYWTFSSTHAVEVVLMNDLFTRDDRRGRGVGRALIEASVEVAHRRGARHLEWLTAQDNAVAQRLYGSFEAERSAWFGYEIET